MLSSVSGCSGKVTDIRFTAANSINQVKNGSPEVDSGIGLENVRKRLALLYPGRHELNISDDGTVYNVELKINTGSQPVS